MAPEQWAGGTVGPATDQFAFCVALWEALTGARPFTGTTLDELRTQITAGPAELDASRLPRRVRAISRRGLDPVAANRWPSMDALLAALIRARSRTALYAAAVVVAVGAAVAAAAMFGGGASAADATACPPAHAPPAAWADALGSAGWTELAAIAHRDVARWTDARAQVCAMPPARRVAQLACLDGATARLDAVVQTLATLTPTADADVMATELVDPTTCMRADPPRLALTASADSVAALALVARIRGLGPRPTLAEADAVAARPHLDACGHALVSLVHEDSEGDPVRRRALAEQAESTAESCKDDLLIAETVENLASYDYETPKLGARGLAAAQRVEVAYDRVGQPDLAAPVDQLHARIAIETERWADAIAATQRALAAYGARGRTNREIATVLDLVNVYLSRSEVTDLLAIRALVATWRPKAVALHDASAVDALDTSDATAMFYLGDDDTAHRELVRLWHPPTAAPVHPIAGRVVDAHGQPVAGATVVCGPIVFTDSIGVLFPLDRRALHAATTDRDGRFTIEGDGALVIAAQLGDRRSLPAAPSDHVTLVLEPTRRVSGTVQIGAKPRTQVLVMALAHGLLMHRYLHFAPIRPDGTFVLDGVSTQQVELALGEVTSYHGGNLQLQELPASRSPVTGLVLTLSKTDRVIDVVVRSTLATPLDLAELFVFPGRAHPKTFRELMSQVRPGDIQSGFAQPAPATGSASRAGDLAFHFTDVHAGELTVCAVGLAGTLEQVEMNGKLQARYGDLELRCTDVAADATRVVVETPPQKRID